MFQPAYYNQIFGKNVNEKVIADLLKIDYYYDLFLRTDIKDKGYDEATVLPMLRNGKTFQIACISFLCKINANIIDYEVLQNLKSNPDEMKKELQKMDGLDRLILHNHDDEKDRMFRIFSHIGEDVLGYCYEGATENDGKGLVASNYLKLDTTFYKDIIKRLWSQYHKKAELKEDFDSIFVK